MDDERTPQSIKKPARSGHADATSKPKRRRAREGDAILQKLTDALKENLKKSADDPDVDAVHDTRTGTRRIEAAIEAELGRIETTEDELTKAAQAWERLLKKIRRAAAPVRDLDVQRKLLKTLAAELKSRAGEGGNPLAEEIARLDDALRAERADRAAPLKKSATGWGAKLDGHREAFAVAPRPSGRRGRRDAAKTALDAFAKLAYQMRQLDAGNLHDFRKGAKKARYMAEQGTDERAGMVGKALKRLQDEIGDWHDWLMLAEEAHRYLDANGSPLTAEIERKRNLHFEMAMQMERKMRGRLIGEGLATRAIASRGRSRWSRSEQQGARIEAQVSKKG
jgi:CHAD domain-containing protein